jgi:hypothetical protein
VATTSVVAVELQEQLLDEDINTSATIIPFIEILGSITRSRAQQLNHQVLESQGEPTTT